MHMLLCGYQITDKNGIAMRVVQITVSRKSNQRWKKQVVKNNSGIA